MNNKPNSTRYNYKPLDKLLTEDLDPVSLGNQPDDIMCDLVSLAGKDAIYSGEVLEWRYFVLRSLRNFFWELDGNV